MNAAQLHDDSDDDDLYAERHYNRRRQRDRILNEANGVKPWDFKDDEHDACSDKAARDAEDEASSNTDI